MPPKGKEPSGKPKEKSKPRDEGPSIQEYVDAVRAGSVTTVSWRVCLSTSGTGSSLMIQGCIQLTVFILLAG